MLSGDGKNIAFVAVDEHDVTQLYVRPLNSSRSVPIPGTEGAEYPFWSPDGKSIGFFSASKLRRVAVSGGPVLDICDAPRPRGGTWAPDNTILFAPDITSGIFRVSASPGSTATEIVPRAKGNTTNRWPHILSDGKHLVYLGTNHSDPYASAVHGIYFASLDGKANRFLVPADSNATFAYGHLLWVQSGSVMARKFDPSNGTLSGETIGLIDGVAYSTSTWYAAFDATGNGVAVYQPGSEFKNSQLLVVGRDGKTEHSFAQADHVLDVRISPDGHRAAILAGGPPFNIWIVDLEKGTRVRLTFDSTPEGMAWSPDGRMIYYSGGKGNEGELLRQAADGSGKPEVLLQSHNSVHVSNLSPHGDYLLFHQPTGSVVSTTWVLPLKPLGTPRVLVPGPAGVHEASFSPDEKWVLYHTTETGRYELYVTSLANGGKQQLTTDGALFSRWGHDAKHIYYLAPDGAVMEMPVTETARTVDAGPAHELFKAPGLSATSFFAAPWDATPDGKHFLLSTTGARDNGTRAVVLLDWQARLKK
jgi:Tol biopolymer transport system component